MVVAADGVRPFLPHHLGHRRALRGRTATAPRPNRRAWRPARRRRRAGSRARAPAAPRSPCRRVGPRTTAEAHVDGFDELEAAQHGRAASALVLSPSSGGRTQRRRRSRRRATRRASGASSRRAAAPRHRPNATTHAERPGRRHRRPVGAVSAATTARNSTPATTGIAWRAPRPSSSPGRVGVGEPVAAGVAHDSRAGSSPSSPSPSVALASRCRTSTLGSAPVRASRRSRPCRFAAGGARRVGLRR